MSGARAFWFFIFGVFIFIFQASLLSAEDSAFPLLFSSSNQITIDGNMDDWPLTVPFILESDSQVKVGSRDKRFSGKISCFFDSQNFYFFARVKDPTASPNKYEFEEIWQNDALEIYLGFRKENRTSYGKNDFQIGMTLSPGEAFAWNWTKNDEISNKNILVVKSTDGCVVEGKIPLSEFNEKSLQPGQTIWIDFSIDNSDGGPRTTQMVWNGDHNGWRNPGLWRQGFLTSDPDRMKDLYILIPGSFDDGQSNRMVIWYNGSPFVDTIDIDRAEAVPDAEGGFTITNQIQNISFMINGRKITRNIPSLLALSAPDENIWGDLPVKKIKVNQLGYQPNEKKEFLFTVENRKWRGKPFKIIDAGNGRKVFDGILGNVKLDNTMEEFICYGDFSSFKKEGKYQIKIEGVEESYPFEIKKNLYKNFYITAMRTYYLQRCGVEIKDKFSGVTHKACHLHDGRLRGFNPNPTNAFWNTTGGWHDAGDYGKYVPSAGAALAGLLLLYEVAGEKVSKISLNIPKNEQNLPDFLEEIKFELDWLLKMQDSDGGVFHKVNSMKFPRTISPDEDELVRYVYEKGTSDTAIFTGVMAMAARLFAAEYPAYSKILKTAALTSAHYLEKHNKFLILSSNDETGSYQTSSVEDELYWAFSELFRLTGNKEYYSYAENYMDQFVEYSPFSWDDTSSLAVYALLKAKGTPAKTKNKLLADVLKQSKKLVERISKEGYRVALLDSEYNWASVKTALAYGVNLVLANQFSPNEKFVEAARRQVDYALGVNALSKSFLTKVGTDSVRYVHHRVVMSSGILIPGLLVGGPNNKAEDGLYPKDLNQKSYIDRPDAYSCNEYAIDYNAPLVFLAAYFMNP